MVAANEALGRLKEGNARYVAGGHSADDNLSAERRLNTSDSQSPFAVILGCSDSRVPAEYVFDQGIGDLFVVRVAGNIAATSQIASVEFALAKFGTKLIVVLGHAQCGAVIATLEDLENQTGAGTVHLEGVVSQIQPAVQAVLDRQQGADREEIIAGAVRENVRHAMADMQRDSTVIADAVSDDAMIVGAEYSLHTGIVEFFT